MTQTAVGRVLASQPLLFQGYVTAGFLLAAER